MNLRCYRAFATELQKLATGLVDADVRALMADRNGEEYLPGGELPTNRTVPADRLTPAGVPIAKIAALAMPSAPHNFDLQAKKKGPAKYQKARDYTVAGVKGALTGGAVLALAHNMRGRQAGDLATKAIRRAAGVGAGASLADRAIRHDEFNGSKVAMVTTNPGAPFKSPAAELNTANNVGKFESKVHNSTAKPSGLIGNKFRIV